MVVSGVSKNSIINKNVIIENIWNSLTTTYNLSKCCKFVKKTKKKVVSEVVSEAKGCK